MALEGLQIAQQGARDLASSFDMRKKRQLEEAKYANDVAEAKRKQTSQTELGVAFGETAEGKTGLGKVQALGIASGELDTKAALDPWFKMSKEQQVWMLQREALTSKDPFVQAQAKLATETMNGVNFAKTFYDTKGRIVAENMFKEKEGDGAAGGGKLKRPLALNTSTILNAINNKFKDGEIVITPKDIPSLGGNFTIDLTKGGVLPQIMEQRRKTILGLIPIGEGDPLSEETVTQIQKYVTGALHQTLKDAIKADQPIFANPAADAYLDKAASTFGSRTFLGGTEFMYKTSDSPSGETRSLIPTFALDDLPSSFYNLQKFPIGNGEAIQAPQVNANTKEDFLGSINQIVNSAGAPSAEGAAPAKSFGKKEKTPTETKIEEQNKNIQNMLQKSRDEKAGKQKVKDEQKKAKDRETVASQIEATKKQIQEAKNANVMYLVQSNQARLAELEKRYASL